MGLGERFEELGLEYLRCHSVLQVRVATKQLYAHVLGAQERRLH